MTIIVVRKNSEVVVAGDGQVSMGNTVVKSTALGVRELKERSCCWICWIDGRCINFICML